MKICGSFATGILAVSVLAAVFISSPARAVWINPSDAMRFEIGEFSFAESEPLIYDFFSISTISHSFEINQSFDEARDALASSYKQEATAPSDIGGAHEFQSAVNFSKTYTSNGDFWSGRDSARLIAQAEAARYTKSPGPQTVNEKEIAHISDPSQYMDQYVYNTVTTYVRHKGLDVEDALTVSTAVSATISTFIHKTNQYAPGLSRSQPALMTEPAYVQITAFEETLPGRLLYWFSNPHNYGTALILFLSILAGVLSLNWVLRKIANNPVRY